DDQGAHGLAGQGDGDAQDVQGEVPPPAAEGQPGPAGGGEDEEDGGEEKVAVLEEEAAAADEEVRRGRRRRGVARLGAHFIASMPQKLYHLKKTSTSRKPWPRSSSLFSSSREGMSTFSRASRFCAISSSE